ncbi:MAG TPA: hypothetical protein VIE16_08865 [Phenylobacterium sp.]
MNVRRPRAAARLLASAGACALLAACVGNPFEDAKVDPRSPVAGEVAKAVRPDAAYPTFASIPPVPKDVRPHRQYGQAADTIEQARTDLEHATADNTWTLNDTEAFAARARADAGPDLGAPQASDTEAFAKAQRKRATPPPPPKR